MLDDALTGRVATAKKRLLDGGMLQEVEWGVVGPARPTVTRDGAATLHAYTPLDALIEQRPARGPGNARVPTASDDTVLSIFDPLAITDEHLFRWGDPPHTYSVKAVDGIVAGRGPPARGTPPKSQLSANLVPWRDEFIWAQ